MMTRYNTDNQYVWNYGDHFLVRCGQCNNCAHVLTAEDDNRPEVRLSCLSCGCNKEWMRKNPGVTYCNNVDYFQDGEIWIGAAVDWYFHLPLWLQIPCCSELLWAYNAEHLFWLKNFISADLRERSENNEHGWQNRSLASRLPKWMKKSSNRDAIMRAINKLEHKL